MCMMSGCQPVPENVKQDIAAMEKAKAEMKEIKENSEYQKVSKISKLAGRRMKEERNLLHIDAEVYVPDALEVYQFQCKNNKAFWLNRYQILEDVSGVKITEDSPYLWGYEQLENYFRGRNSSFILQIRKNQQRKDKLESLEGLEKNI